MIGLWGKIVINVNKNIDWRSSHCTEILSYNPRNITSYRVLCYAIKHNKICYFLIVSRPFQVYVQVLSFKFGTNIFLTDKLPLKSTDQDTFFDTQN